MWDIISGIIVLTLALIGFVECIRNILFLLYKPKGENSILAIFCKSEKSDDIEYTLRSWATKIKWLGKTAPETIVFITDKENEEKKIICEKFSDEYGYIEFATEKEFAEMVEKRIHKE